jgi:hypothetical protein
VEFALRDLIEEGAHFVVLARNLKFDTAIRQVTDPASYVETLGGVAY